MTTIYSRHGAAAVGRSIGRIGALCAICAVMLLAGCVTGRRTISLPDAAHGTTMAAKGKVYIDAVTDDRHFENRPSEPSTPSVDGDVNQLSPQQKDQMIGRQRNTYGHGMGDVALPHGDSVTKRMRSYVEQGLARAGYAVTADPTVPNKATVSVREFWSWMTPGFAALTFEAKISCQISVHNSSGDHVVTASGYGKNHGQFAKDANWQEAWQPAVEDFVTNLAAQAPSLTLQAD